MSRVPFKATLLDGSTRTVMVFPTATAREICEAIARRMDIKPFNTCGLWQCKKDKMKRILDTELPLSIQQQWKNPKDRFFLIKHKLLFPDDPLPTSSVALHFLFIQALAAFSGGSFVPSAEDATRLAGLAAFAHIGPCTDQRREWVVSHAIKFAAPCLLASRSVPEVEQLVATMYAQVNADSTDMAMRKYIEICRKYDLYPTSQFLVQQLENTPDRGLVIRIPKLYLAVFQYGVYILQFPDKEIVERHLFTDIKEWLSNKSELHLTISRGAYDGDDMRIMFSTYQAREIASLIHDYVHAFVERKRQAARVAHLE